MALHRGLFRNATVDDTAAAERRRSVRHVTVLQVAKLRTPLGEELCLLRDVSEEGLKAEVYSRIADGDTVSVELRTGHCVTGKVVWLEKPMMGVRFLEKVPILAMLAHCAFDERLTRLRPPRIDIDLPAVLTTWDEVLDIRVRNVSQAGLGIEVGKAIAADTECDIVLPGLAKRNARIRWSHKGECGLQLDHTLSYREFAAWRGLLAAQADAGAPPTAA